MVKGNDRSKVVKMNIILSFAMKAMGIGLSFLTLPLTVHYLTNIEYGVWVTLFSIMNWINVLDIGIGLGMRNKLAEAVAIDDKYSIRMYMATGFFSMAAIGVTLLIIFLLGIHDVPMQRVFNTDAISETELFNATLCTGIFIIVSFVLGLITQVYYAYQRAAMNGAMSVLQGTIMLISVYALTKSGTHSLVYFVFAFGISMLLSKLIFITIFFAKHADTMPRWSNVRWDKLKSITSMGIQFFIIQICTIFGFGFSDVLITQLVGPEFVRTYDVIFKIFNVSVMVQGLILTPLWSAYTEAYAQHDFRWIKTIFKKTIKITAFIIVCMLIVSIFIDNLIYLWLHLYFEYSIWLIIGMIIYHSISLLAGCFCMVLNGIGRLRLQMYAWIVSAGLVIPVSWYMTQVLKLGNVGIIWTLVISLSVLMLMLPIDVWRLFHSWEKVD